MEKIVSWSIALFLIILSACRSNSDQQTSSIREIPVDVTKNDSIGTVFQKEYQAIPLETNDSLLIARVDKILLTDSAIFIADKNQGTLFLFDRQGYGLGKLSHRGIAPGEYIDFSDFEVRDNRIFILSRSSKKILIYTFSDQLVGEIKLDDWYDFFHLLNDRELLLYSNFSNDKLKNVLLFDYKKGKIIETFLPFQANQSFSFPQCPFNEADAGTLITQPYDYLVYRFDGSGIYGNYRFTFNTKDQLPENKEMISFATLYEDLRDKSLVKHIKTITASDSIVYATFVLDYVNRIVRADLRSNDVKCVTLEDQENFPFAFLIPLSYCQGWAVGVEDADNVLCFAENFPSDKQPDGLLKADDNPVVFLRKLR